MPQCVFVLNSKPNHKMGRFNNRPELCRISKQISQTVLKKENRKNKYNNKIQLNNNRLLHTTIPVQQSPNLKEKVKVYAIF